MPFLQYCIWQYVVINEIFATRTHQSHSQQLQKRNSKTIKRIALSLSLSSNCMVWITNCELNRIESNAVQYNVHVFLWFFTSLCVPFCLMAWSFVTLNNLKWKKKEKNSQMNLWAAWKHKTEQRIIKNKTQFALWVWIFMVFTLHAVTVVSVHFCKILHSNLSSVSHTHTHSQMLFGKHPELNRKWKVNIYVNYTLRK